MKYVEGFVAAVPAANKEIYRKHAAEAAPLFKEFGATRVVECWGDDVPEGKLTDFQRRRQSEGRRGRRVQLVRVSLAAGRVTPRTKRCAPIRA